MNLEQYQQFIKTQAELQDLAYSYAKVWNEVENGPDPKNMADHSITEIEFEDDKVFVGWYWSGSYGADDKGQIVIPIDVLFWKSRSLAVTVMWQIHLEKERDSRKQKEEAERKQKEFEKKVAEGRRCIHQKVVKVNGELIDFETEINPSVGDVVKVGKHECTIPDSVVLMIAGQQELAAALHKPQEVQIVFSVTGFVKQTVVLNRNIPAKELQEMLNAGTASTTIQSNGEVFYGNDNIGRVVSVDNECEYEDFIVEEIEHGEQE
jgi:hypothetical protein